MESNTNLLVKACVTACKGGVPQEQLDDEFFKFTGEYIPYLKLGYYSMYEYLGTIQGLIKKRNDKNELVYHVSDPNINHITKMVEQQKDPYYGLHCTKTVTRSTNTGNSTVDKNTTGWKRKATSDAAKGKPSQKRRKRNVRNPNRAWNRLLDHVSSSEEDGHHHSWDKSDHERWFEDEYNHPIKINEKPQKLDVVVEPIVNGKQLIGDDYFLQLAIRNVGSPIWRNGPCTALHVGLCKSGQTIKECIYTLTKVKVLSNRLVILLGAEDIYRGHSSERMIADMEDLLACLETHFAFSKSAITLCTIPPLANLSMHSHRNQIKNLQRFNAWIKAQAISCFNDSWVYRYNLIDFYDQNIHVWGNTNYEFFQLDARMVSGSSHPYVLWNPRGRRVAMSLLRGDTW